MQPEAAQIARLQVEIGQVSQNQLLYQWHDLFEDSASLLPEQDLIPFSRRCFRAVKKAEIIANVVRKLRLQARAKNFEGLGRGESVFAFDDDRRTGIAKDEVAVAVAEIKVGRADFRADHQHRARPLVTHRINSGLDAEGGRGAGDVEVESKAFYT